jgi:parafibromin
METLQQKASSSQNNNSKSKSTNSASNSADASYNQLGQKKSWRPHLLAKKPIIVVPKGMTAPVTLLNALEFFGHSKFVPRDVMMKNNKGGNALNKMNNSTTFSRRVGSRQGGGMVEYELMDNPNSKLHSQKDWDRVVAVIALGASWQFKDWPGPIYNNPVRLFGSVYGFYIGMEGDNVPAELQGWSVVRSKLNRDKRGLDSVTHASFWNGLDEFMAIHKPEMLPQEET